MTMRRLRLATMALQIRDTLPAIDDNTDSILAATDAIYRLAMTCHSRAYLRDRAAVHRAAMELAAHALRLAEWAAEEGE